ncbi:MAG: DUF2520 domain-containing protein [Chloroflexota bacterium]|nr:DUF2520 domain-containing protein [Chloroflexota bacterium]
MHDTETAPGHAHEPAGHQHPHPPADPNGRPRIGIIGAGRVGTALGVAFSRAGWPVAAVASRDESRRARFIRLVPTASAHDVPARLLDAVDLIFLCVPDDAVAGVAGQLRLYGGQAIVHTSGALPAKVLEPGRAAGTSAASFHPLVAFAEVERAVADLHGATVALEGDEVLLSLLSDLVEAIGAQPVRLPPGGKPGYHAAAVLAAGGFIGLLDAIAEVARGAGLDEAGALAIYGPLIRQSLANAETLGIGAALTGPLARGDRGTVSAHLDALRRLAPSTLGLYVAVAHREIALAETRGDLPAERARELRELLDQS